MEIGSANPLYPTPGSQTQAAQQMTQGMVSTTTPAPEPQADQPTQAVQTPNVQRVEAPRENEATSESRSATAPEGNIGNNIDVTA